MFKKKKIDMSPLYEAVAKNVQALPATDGKGSTLDVNGIHRDANVILDYIVWRNSREIEYAPSLVGLLVGMCDYRTMGNQDPEGLAPILLEAAAQTMDLRQDMQRHGHGEAERALSALALAGHDVMESTGRMPVYMEALQRHSASQVK